MKRPTPLILISHRGNIDGKNPERENNPEYVLEAIERGYDVEVDVWYKNGFSQFYLGHDKPEYPVDLSFLKNDKIWCHAKDSNALELMLIHKIHCFWHENDERTLTSKGYVWTHYNAKYICRAICVLPEINNKIRPNLVPWGIAGVCSDFIKDYNEYK